MAKTGTPGLSKLILSSISCSSSRTTPRTSSELVSPRIAPVRLLVTDNPSSRRQIGDFALSVLPETGPDSTCLDVLNYFQQGRSHILLVSRVSLQTSLVLRRP